MKKLLTLGVTLALAVMLFACKGGSQHDAVKVGDKFIKAMSVMDFREAMKYTTGDALGDLRDQAERMTEFLNSDEPQAKEIQKALKKANNKFTYNKEKSTIGGTEAELVYDYIITTPEKYETTVELELVKIDGKWYVSDYL